VSEAGGISDDISGAVIEHYGRTDGGARLDIDSEGGGGLGLEPHAHEAGGGRGGRPVASIRIGIEEGLLPLHLRREPFEEENGFQQN